MAKVLTGKKILIVSSDPVFLDFFREFGEEGCKVIETPKTDDGHFFPLIGEGNFDLVILDAIIPEETKKEEKLSSRTKQLFPTMPVMIFSAHAVPKDGNAIRAVDLNGDHYLDDSLKGCFVFNDVVMMVIRVISQANATNVDSLV